MSWKDKTGGSFLSINFLVATCVVSHCRGKYATDSPHRCRPHSCHTRIPCPPRRLFRARRTGAACRPELAPRSASLRESRAGHRGSGRWWWMLSSTLSRRRGTGGIRQRFGLHTGSGSEVEVSAIQSTHGRCSCSSTSGPWHEHGSDLGQRGRRSVRLPESANRYATRHGQCHRLTLLAVTLQLGARMPHRVQHRHRTERALVVVVKLRVSLRRSGVAHLFKRPVQLAAHAPLFPVRSDRTTASIRCSEVRLPDGQSARGVRAEMPVVLLRQEVGLEEGVVDQRLEDGG